MTIRRHWAYASYVARHKWFVLRARKLTGCGLWRALVHDLSKFLPSEWFPYAEAFYAEDGTKRYQPGDGFSLAWLLHQKRNRHHWQYWVRLKDGGDSAAIPIPERYARELVADWIGAGLAITGRMEVVEWYEENKHKMCLHPDTRALVEEIIASIAPATCASK